MSDDFDVTIAQLNEWAQSLERINHHGLVIQRELKAGNVEQAADLAEKARLRAWKILNELVACGAERPEEYRESAAGPDSGAEGAADGEGTS